MANSKPGNIGVVSLLPTVNALPSVTNFPASFRTYRMIDCSAGYTTQYSLTPNSSHKSNLVSISFCYFQAIKPQLLHQVRLNNYVGRAFLLNRKSRIHPVERLF